MKSKKRLSTFLETCEVKFFGNSMTKNIFCAECLLKVRTGTYLVTKSPADDTN